VKQSAKYAMVQASNLRVCKSGINAIRIDAPNVKFFGENVSLEDWTADEAFGISSSSSFAYLGIGFNCVPGNNKVACYPEQQFHLAS
jgi:hypothetical protein